MPQGLNLRERFELDRPLTDGRIASTYRGVAMDSGASVALKVLRARQLPESEARVDEALELLGRLSDARIESHARIYEYGTTDTGDLYVATQWLEGQPLLDSGRLHPAEALSAVRDAAALLQAFSDHGLAHLNVRPDNLFRRADGSLALTGLGTGYLLPPDGIVQEDEYWAPELDLPPRGFRRDFWQADVFALARTALHLLNAQVSGAATRVPHIRLPDGLESAFESGPALCLLLEESLHESPDRRPSSWTTLLDCLDQSLTEAPPEAPSFAAEQAEGAMQSLREMWADGLSDIDLRSGGRSFDPNLTQKIPTISLEDSGTNIVLSEEDVEIISADQEITTEIRLPEPLAKRYVDRRKPRAHQATTAEIPIAEQLPPIETPAEGETSFDEEVEELFASHTATVEIPEPAAPTPQPEPEPEPAPRSSSVPILTTSSSRGPAIDWTRPGYAAKRSDPWENFRDIDWLRVGLAAGLLMAIAGAFLLFRWFDRSEDGAPDPPRTAQTPLEIDTSQVERDRELAASQAPQSEAPESEAQESEAQESEASTSSGSETGAAGTDRQQESSRDQEIAGAIEPRPEPSTPLEALVADLPEQVVPTTQIVPVDDDAPRDRPTVRARVAEREPPASRTEPPTRGAQPPKPRTEPPRRRATSPPPPQQPEPRTTVTPTQRPRPSTTPRRTDPAPPPRPSAPSVDPVEALRTRLDEALRGGDSELLFRSLADDRLAALKQREEGRRLAVFAEIAAAGLESTERLLESQSWGQALEAANRLESQFPSLAKGSALRERAATGMERRAERLIAQGAYGRADRQLRALRALWPERANIDDKLRELAGRRQQERNERILAEVATAANTDKPHEALALLAELEGQIASGDYERRRTELENQLTRLDSSAPTVSLDPFDDASFVRGQPLELQLQIQDDYEVVSVELRLRRAGSDDFLDVPIEKVGGRIYRSTIPASMHGSRKVGVWVRATDRSGNVGELGTARRPLRLKPRRARATTGP